MRIGIVCPYSFDAPGGVQFHVRDLAELLLEQGHHVSVLAPAEDDTPVPSYLRSVGGAIPVRYNGSVARLAYGPKVSVRTQTWLDEGRFDVVHIHEPFVPSCSLIALRRSQAPIVATFHSAQERSRMLLAAEPFMRPGFERLSARIAVSADARRTIYDHFGSDAIVIPNGVYVDRFATAVPNPAWQGTAAEPTIAFLGRLNEPRKGLPVLLEAIGAVRRGIPGARFLIAGGGNLDPADLGEDASAVTVLGSVSEEDKASLLASVDLYIAPQTGGESFGIVLVEAMSAGATVIASDITAFAAVLDGGRAGFLFRNEDSAHLAQTIITALADPGERTRRRAHASIWTRQFDWPVVAAKIYDVYAMVAGQTATEFSPKLSGSGIGGLRLPLPGRFRGALRRRR